MNPWIALTFAVGISLSAAAAWNAQRINDRHTPQALKIELQETADAVGRRIHLYQFGLRGLRGAIHAVEQQQLSYAGFQRYSQTRDISHEFPGARGFGVIRRVPRTEEAAFVAQQRRDGQPDFSIHEFKPHDGERFVVQYISPQGPNQAGFGLDIASEPTRQKAAQAAMLTGEAQITPPILFYKSVSESENAFLMLLPVYQSAQTPDTVAERSATAIGWSYALLEIDDMLQNLGVYQTGLGLRLFDITDASTGSVFYNSPQARDEQTVIASQSVEREIFGRRWRLEMQAYPAFIASLNQTSPRQVFLLGVLISVLVTALLLMLANLRQRQMDIFADQARLAAIVESSSDGIIGKDLTGVITSWNKGAESIFGHSAEQAVGHRLADLLVPPNLQAQETDILAHINRGERVAHFETQRLHRDGHLVDVSVAVAPIRDATGVIIGASKTVRDITAQKAAEASLQRLYADMERQVAERTTELQQAKLQADSANAAKSSFLANMSHEIRTPLNAVLGMLQLLLHTTLNTRQLDYVDKAKSAASSLLGLLNDILDFSKIEAGKLQLEVTRFELDTLMRNLAVVLSGNQGEKEVEVVFDLSPTLPSVLAGDSLRLQQILINLAGNALKFTHEGYVIVSITSIAQSDSDVVLRIAVTDTGIGIAKEHQAHIFTGFAQAEASTSRRFGGSGLGLVICKRLVELMGGQLQLLSEPGQGSRFWFDLGFAVESGRTLEADCETTDQRLRVLIADDNPVVAELMQHTVEALGWQADVVYDGRQAVNQVRQAQPHQPYDVVLMDWRMPELDGVSAAQMIHDDTESERQPVVVMISAYGRELLAQMQQIAHSPFIDFLTKPVTPQQLAHTVKQALSGNGKPVLETINPPTLHNRLRGLRLLVVEDNALNRQVAAELLASEGAVVQLAKDGLQGVTMALDSEPPFDAVIMDIQMPGIDGYEATRRIRAEPHGAHFPILAMTANASAADRSQCLAAGMNEHVGKPIDINQLVEALCRLTGHAGSKVGLHSPLPSPSNDQLIEDGGSILSRFGMNLDLLQRLLEDYQQDALALLSTLHQHVQRQDSDGQRAVLHALKGSSGSIGATALYQMAGELEQQLRNQPESGAPPLINASIEHQLRQLLTQSVEQLRTWLATLDTPDTHQNKAQIAMPTALWHAKRHTLLALLDAGNMRALELVEELARANPPAGFEGVVQQVHALMFNAAAQRLRELG
ncbi:CHASE domain-containing protein [Pseudomonas turukhanskensis]|uniref:Sensory/regulatory protein RpfC n=1 Tax=Pseudomonas turukhanskensis TaxID=1806536 RepID=A0A9W6K443_9PSED|nr:CHASE domain-containing protein [Pseudomonas turukhanskensis]GLK88492.1 hypothetical protein GCM10017655_15540 [Pseudomonas turukhanskensis]